MMLIPPFRQAACPYRHHDLRQRPVPARHFPRRCCHGPHRCLPLPRGQCGRRERCPTSRREGESCSDRRKVKWTRYGGEGRVHGETRRRGAQTQHAGAYREANQYKIWGGKILRGKQRCFDRRAFSAQLCSRLERAFDTRRQHDKINKQHRNAQDGFPQKRITSRDTSRQTRATIGSGKHHEAARSMYTT